MLLTIDEVHARARLPLAFRAAVSMAIGAVAAWLAEDAIRSWAADRTIVDAHPTDHRAWLVGLAAAGCGVGALAAIGLPRRALRDFGVLLVALGVGWMLALDASADRDAPAPQPGVATLEGIVATEPRIDEAGSDELSDHAMRQASTSFRLAVAAAVTDGGRRSWKADVTCRVGGMAPLPSRGSRVRVTGWIRSVERALNPGQRPGDPRLVLGVTSSRSVEALESSWLERALVGLRATANERLRDSMPAWASDRTRALVQAMTTGVRVPGLAAAAGDFRDAGMSHVLAISGFNVAVLVAAATLCARLAGAGFRARAAVGAVTAAAFLSITEPDTSVVRAGLGAGLAAVASMRGGNARGLGTLGAVAIASMLLDVECIAGAGFQLSYGVVVALLVLAPAVARRWMQATASVDGRLARPRSAAFEASCIVRSFAIEMTASATVAWTISTPIALWHGGAISPLAVPLSIATMPMAAGATVAGVAAMVTGTAWQRGSCVVGSVAAACAGGLDRIAQLTAHGNLGSARLAPPPWWWCVAALLAAWMAWAAPTAPRRAIAACLLVLLVGALAAGAVPTAASERPAGSLTVDALAVSRGSCTVVRTDTACIVLNCGSWSSAELGSRTVVPALLATGVRSIDAVVILGRGLGSMSALPELLVAFRPRRVLLDAAARSWIDGSRDAAAAAIRASLAACPAEVSDLGTHACAVGDLSLRARSIHRGKRDDTVLELSAAGCGSTTVCTTDGAAGALPGGSAAARPLAEAASRTVLRKGTTRVQRWTPDGWR